MAIIFGVNSSTLSGYNLIVLFIEVVTKFNVFVNSPVVMLDHEMMHVLYI